MGYVLIVSFFVIHRMQIECDKNNIEVDQVLFEQAGEYVLGKFCLFIFT